MNPDRIRAELQAIQDAATAGDPLAHALAHVAEDSLYRDLLRAIANGAVDNPAELAALALEAEEIDFQRMCSDPFSDHPDDKFYDPIYANVRIHTPPADSTLPPGLYLTQPQGYAVLYDDRHRLGVLWDGRTIDVGGLKIHDPDVADRLAEHLRDLANRIRHALAHPTTYSGPLPADRVGCPTCDPNHTEGDPTVSDTITLRLAAFGTTTVEVDAADYEEARTDGELAEFLDTDLSDLDTDNAVVEPDGTYRAAMGPETTATRIALLTAFYLAVTGATDEAARIVTGLSPEDRATLTAACDTLTRSAN